jgi:hypothetical protein
MASRITSDEDLIDSRDIIARIDELREERETLRAEFDEVPENAGVDFDAWARNQIGFDGDEADELRTLEALQADAEQYAPDWQHGATLIRDSYFKEYAQQLANDQGAIDSDAGWPCNCIDWDEAARQLMQDYTEVDFDGVTYYVR